MIDMLEYHGYVQGKMLLDQGFDPGQVPDEMRTTSSMPSRSAATSSRCSSSPIAAQASALLRHVASRRCPAPSSATPCRTSSHDIQDATNAALRSLINNMSIASGPQVVVNDDRIADNENSDELYPWKRWHVVNDPMGNNGQPPIRFFQPNSNAQELLGVYEKFTQIADELSAIPRYITGSERLGGAGRTASGLAMLMGNAAKILQTVAANIDNDVIEPVISELYDMVMLTDRPACSRRRDHRRARRQRRHAARDAAPAPAGVPADHRQPDRHADHGRRAAAPTCCARSPTASASTARTSCRPTRRSSRDAGRPRPPGGAPRVHRRRAPGAPPGAAAGRTRSGQGRRPTWSARRRGLATGTPRQTRLKGQRRRKTIMASRRSPARSRLASRRSRPVGVRQDAQLRRCRRAEARRHRADQPDRQGRGVPRGRAVRQDAQVRGRQGAEVGRSARADGPRTDAREGVCASSRRPRESSRTGGHRRRAASWLAPPG